ncbi:MAG: hypothetical protein Kow0076_0940 [Francisella sp.]
MKKQGLFLLFLVIFSLIVLVLFYRFSQWYEQTIGEIFSYIIMIFFVLFIFSPFKFMKDKQADVSIFNYFKYMGISLFKFITIVINIFKQAILTFSYVVMKLFTSHSQNK